MKIAKTIFGICILAFAGISLSARIPNQTARADPARNEILSDLSYKDGPSAYEKERCRLDLYLPKGVKDFPVVIWFHGGGLKAGGKDDPSATGVGRRLSAEGIGVAVANYRFSPKVKFPAYIEDAAAAFAWVHKNIAKYGGNPGRIFIGGHSAGAYLTGMVGLDGRFLKAQGRSTGEIAGLIPVSGQIYSHSTVREERGIPAAQKILDESAVLFHVRVDAPPVLCICADADTILGDNKIFVEKLKSAGHPRVEFFEIPNRTHMTIITDIEKPGDDVARHILRFIRTTASAGSSPR